MEWIRIGKLTNYYGGIHVLEYQGKYYLGIEDHHGPLGSQSIDLWLRNDIIEEIPKYLYDSLIRFNKSNAINNT